MSPRRELPQGGPADGADRIARRHVGPDVSGGGPIDPDPALGHAGQFPLPADRASGRRALATRAFDVSLVLHADHELNASTFAARVAAATLTDIHSAIVGARSAR